MTTSTVVFLVVVIVVFVIGLCIACGLAGRDRRGDYIGNYVICAFAGIVLLVGVFCLGDAQARHELRHAVVLQQQAEQIQKAANRQRILDAARSRR